MKKLLIGMTVMAMTATMFGAQAFADGSKTIKVDKLLYVGNEADQRASKIEFKENGKEAWGSKVKVELKLPSNVKWNNKTTLNGKHKPLIKDNVLSFDLETTKEEDSFYILPYIDLDRSVPKGNISVAVSPMNQTDKEETVDIATVSDFAVSFSSNYQQASANSKIAVELTLNELVENSLLPDNIYDLAFDNATIEKDSVKINQTGGFDPLTVNKAGDSYLELKLNKKFATKNKWTITMNITPKKDYTGEIKASFEGRGLENQSTVVANVYQGLTFGDRILDELTLGKADQIIGDVTFNETMASSLPVGDYTVKINPEYKGLKFSNISIATEGNIVVNAKNSQDNTLKFSVTQSSTKASKITLKGAKVTIDRFAYDGTYKMVLVNDKAPNTEIVSKDVFTINAATSTKPTTVPTTTDSTLNVGKTIKFVIGQADYSVNEEAKTLDVAPYIKNSRTMLPVRAVAESLDMNVAWDAKTYTATLTSADKTQTVIVTIGNKNMLVNGKVLPLDSAAEIKGDRSFLPLAQIAQAVGAKVDWDHATKTVTLTK